MNRLLTALECIALIAAVVLGFLWAKNPAGPFEPYAFMATLIGTTATDFVRRHLAAKQAERDAHKALFTLIPVITQAIDAQFSAAHGKHAPPSPQILRAELMRLLPEILQTAIAQWEKAQRGKPPASPPPTATPTVRAAKSAPQAYGIDPSKNVFGETTLTEVRLKRKDFDK